MDHLKLQQRKFTSMRLCSAPYPRTFLGKEILIFPNVFAPATDTKLLISSVTINPQETVLETCAGTGVISLFLANKAKKIVAVDINPAAIQNMNVNIQKHGLKNMQALLADLFPPLEKFDVIVLNPPYTDKEAKDIVEKSMWDKEHGLIQRFFQQARNYLSPHGRIYCSWANFADFKFIEHLAVKNNFTNLLIAEFIKEDKIYRVYELRNLTPSSPADLSSK